jgi:hypothetical protein
VAKCDFVGVGARKEERGGGICPPPASVLKTILVFVCAFMNK